MPSAATSSITSSGIQANRGRTSAMPRAKNASTQKNVNRVAARKAPTAMKASGELK